MTLGAENDNDVDWDDLFEPFQTGDPTTVDETGITDGEGNDINLRYAPIGIAGGQRITGDTGCTPYQGGDVADLFAAKGSRGAALSISVPETRAFSCSTAGDSCTAAGTISAQAYGGTAPYTYAWTKVSGNGNIVSGADTDTVQVSYETGGTSTGIFRCTGTDNEGVPVTAHADCTVTWKYVYEDDLAVSVPATASGSCQTSGNACVASTTVHATVIGGQAPFTYQWQKVSGPGSIGAGAQTATCTVSESVQDSDVTIVHCTVHDATGFQVTSGQCAVTLSLQHVNSLLVTVPASASGDCFTGGSSCSATASVHCSVGGGYPPYTFLWSVVSGGAHIASGQGADTCTVNESVQGTDVSHVKCTVHDSLGFSKDSNLCAVTLRYNFQPTLAASVPATASCSCTTQGSSCHAHTQLHCTVSGGQGPFDYEWQVVSGAGTITSGGATSTATVDELVSQQAQSTYRCKVTGNQGTSVFSNNCLVTFSYQQGVGCCFIEGTSIAMKDGSEKTIEDVRIGDWVIGWDFLNNCHVPVEVLAIEAPMRDHHYKVCLSDGGLIGVTDEHPFRTRTGWAAISVASLLLENPRLASDVQPLAVGDALLSLAGDYLAVVTEIRRIDGAIQTYNLRSVSGGNNYFCGGVLVHNKGGCIAPEMWLEYGVRGADAVIGEEYDCVTDSGRLGKYQLKNNFGTVPRPCVWLITANRCALHLSAETPVNLPGATRDLQPGFWRRARDMQGASVLTVLDGPIRWHIRRWAARVAPAPLARALCCAFRPWLRWSRVMLVIPSGDHPAAHLSFGGESYAAGYSPWRRISTHNDDKQ